MKKTKFTVIDLLIVLVLLAVIGFGFIRVRSNIIDNNSLEKVQFSVMATRVNAGNKDIVNVGDEVTISLSEKAYATVVGVSEVPHSEFQFNPKLKKYVSEEIEGKADIIIELECMANVSDTEILDGKVPIRVGAEANVRGKGYAFEGYIITVDDSKN